MQIVRIIALSAFCSLALVSCSSEIDPQNPEKATDRAVKPYLKQIGGSPNAAKDISYRDLNQDGRNEAIVQLKGDTKLCVPEGCPMLVFENTGKKYKFVSKTDKVKSIKGETKAKQGWKSLVVTTGTNAEDTFILSFDNGYPTEASLGKPYKKGFHLLEPYRIP